MLLTCLALGLISCRDTIDPREAKSPSPVQKQEASGPVTVLRLTCILSVPENGQRGDVHCGEPGAGRKGVSQSVILPWFSQYAIWLPTNLVKDPATETWTFVASVRNLLAQPIGTLDGTTAVGTKVVVTYGPVATQGSGDVWITNADGTGTFTAPNQPYFDYPAIIDPQETSPTREMKTHVPSTVTEVTIGIAISTDFPAEQNVAASPPDSEPAWFGDDTSWVNHGDAPGGFLKNVISVLFQDGTSVADKQLAIALVNGTVIGGATFMSGEGYYLLRIEDDGTGTQLRAATAKLQALPQVYGAVLVPRVRPAYLKPHDGTGWTQWSLNPDQLSVGNTTWALEAINAPMAWGCSVGSATTKIGIVDEYFDSTDVAPNVISGSGLFGEYPDSIRHGGPASAILAARGNDTTGITGTMWNAGLMLDSPGHDVRVILPLRVAQAVQRLSNAGASVLNLSWERGYSSILPPTAVDSASADSAYMFWIYPKLRDLQNAGKLPLLVVSAGNSNVDAYLNPFTHIAGDFPAIVVGGSARDRTRYHIPPGMPAEADRRGSNFGPLLDVYAPGKDVPTEAVVSGSIVPVTVTGTSFAAPFITGIAGLLKSFDPSLTATQMRDLILDGASRGGRVITDEMTSKTVYLANAYESLRLAAARPGAPLCGNHVWLVGDAWNDTIVVQRSGGAADRIWSDPDGALAIVNVKHGGHRISYNGPFQEGAIVYDPMTRAWRAESEADSLPPAIDGGTYNSFWWTSHGGDSSLSFPTSSQTVPTVTIDLYDSHAGTSSPLATVPTSLVNSVDSICVKEEIATHACESWGTGGLRQAANVLAAYSPVGDSAIISVARTETYVHDVSNWTPCGSVDSTGEHTDECRALTYGKRSVDTKFYTIPTNSFTSSPSVSWTMSGARATQLAITEDGSEVIIGHGAEQSLGGSQQFANCGITYRNRSTGQESPVIPSEPACIYFGAATASPLRRPGITVKARE